MTLIRTALASEYSTLIDFANDVFAEDFKTLVPKLYRNHPEKAANHLLFLDDAKIQGLIGAFPFSWHCGSTQLKAVGIGTVCVHPQARQLGYMSQLFDNLMPELQKHQFDFAFLGGQRQRYEPWGFSVSGMTYRFQLTQANARHFRGKNFTGSFRLATSEDTNFLLQALKLYEQQPFTLQRTVTNFWEICQTWHNQLHWIFDADDNWLGYLVTNQELTIIHECYLCDSHQLVTVLYAWLQHHRLEQLEIEHPPVINSQFTELTTVAEHLQATTNTNFAIFNFARVIAATLRFKAHSMPLLSGRVIIQIANEQPLAITVAENTVTVAVTADPVEVHFTRLEATRLLFSNQAEQISHPLLRAWAPLPLFILAADNV